MYKHKIIFFILMSALMVTAALGQTKPASPQIKTVTGTVTKMDFVGNTISILTDDQHQLSFFVPGNATITRNTHDIGLMDIKEGHSVTIQYDVSSPGKDIAESITDNKPSAEDSIDE